MSRLIEMRQEMLRKKLVELLQAEDDPAAAVQEAAAVLLEAGMANLPGWVETPEAFARAVIVDNPLMYQHLTETTRPVEPLDRFETAEELVLFLIPSSESLD
jgi:hypothetical protein